MTSLRFSVVFGPDAPLPELEDRWQAAEELGFDAVYLADGARDWRSADIPALDAWTLLATMAQATTTIRVGMLVANPILRPPVTMARAAVAVDHLSSGRLDLGIGTGIAGFDHDAAGVPYWPMAERMRRFREYVEIVDGLLTHAGRQTFDYRGQHLSTAGLVLRPAAVQRPRPPILVAGQSPTVRCVAAERADIWNTHGPFSSSVDEVLGITRRQNSELDRWCEEAGRSPGDLRRSLLAYHPPEPGVDVLSTWESPSRFTSVVERFAEVGITEFVVIWPEDDAQRSVFEQVTTGVLPRMRD